MALLTDFIGAHFAIVIGYYPSEYLTKHDSYMMVPQSISVTQPEITLRLPSMGNG
jgi:hypothetical protein